MEKKLKRVFTLFLIVSVIMSSLILSGCTKTSPQGNEGSGSVVSSEDAADPSELSESEEVQERSVIENYEVILEENQEVGGF